MDSKSGRAMAPSLNTNTSLRPLVPMTTSSSPASPETPSTKSFRHVGTLSPLTPPSSPPRRVGSLGDLKAEIDSLEILRSSVDVPRSVTYTNDGAIICPYEVDLVMDQNGRKQMFGYGAWSNVYKGTCRNRTETNHGLLTPSSSWGLLPPLLVAVKSPARKDGVTILRHEAHTLSLLRGLDAEERYVAAFHGIIDNESSLVLAAHPLSLEDHIKMSARSAQTTLTTSNMSLPVIGSASVWLDLADKLINTLSWLHSEAMVVHGDIKPGNIVLKPLLHGPVDENKFQFQPLFIDFSSSQNLNSMNITPNTLSAVTKEYTAPELLTVAVLKDPNSCATTASDVFSLAVTLLVAATGDTMVYSGYSAMQRQMLATQGWGVLTNVRSLSPRVPKQGVVSRVLEPAVLKKDMGRVSTSTWSKMVEGIQKDVDGPSKL